MRLQDVMNTQVETISKDNSAEEAWNLMERKDIRHLVVMEGKNVVGILSQRDLGGEHGEKFLKKHRVEDLMTHKVVQAKARTTLREAANLLRGDAIGCLPVLDDDGKLVGIITITDLLDMIGQGIERIVADTEKRPSRSLSPAERMKIH